MLQRSRPPLPLSRRHRVLVLRWSDASIMAAFSDERHTLIPPRLSRCVFYFPLLPSAISSQSNSSSIR
jgi:hypothetical protein